MKRIITSVIVLVIASTTVCSTYAEELSFSFNELFEKHGSVMLIIDVESGKIIEANQAAAAFYGYSHEKLITMRIDEINMLSPAEVAAERKAASREERNYFLFSHRLANGEIRTVEVYSYPFETEGKVLLYSIIYDITLKKQLEESLKTRNLVIYIILFTFIFLQLIWILLLTKSVKTNKIIQKELNEEKEKYQTLFNNMVEGFALHEIICDDAGNPVDYRFLDVNKAFENITGLKGEEIKNKTVLEVLPETEDYWIEKYGEVALNGKTMSFEDFPKEMGRYFYVNVFSPEKGKFAVIFFDTTEEKQRQEKIEYLSYHDQLTGLYNRRYFEEELKRLDSQRNLPISIIMADVNGLKLTNDAFGHAMGDKLLKEAADIMEKACRCDDIVARIGGDEFVILLPKTDAEETERIIQRIKDASANVSLDSVVLSISLGWAVKRSVDEDMRETFKKAEDHMYKNKLSESPSMRGKTIRVIINTLHQKDKEEERHATRVSIMCEKLGREMGLTDIKVNELKTLGLLHDIGKIAVNEKILNKKGLLTDEEWEEIKRHSEIGYRIISSVNNTAELAEYILAHHERWDGAGYPKGLKGEEIPLHARILTIVDAYDAMTSNRPYRSALSEGYAVEEIKKKAGTQFDPMLARIFVEKVLGKSW
ncbi:MAG: HD domain-containing phosphohydrolase [Bacillota bacterium]